MKKFKIIKQFTSYSKKKGSVQNKVTLEKDLTWEQVEQWINKNHPGKKLDENKSFQVPGFLYPEKIIVK